MKRKQRKAKGMLKSWERRGRLGQSVDSTVLPEGPMGSRTEGESRTRAGTSGCGGVSPRVKLVVQGAGAHDADEVGDEHHRRDVCTQRTTRGKIRDDPTLHRRLFLIQQTVRLD